MIHEESLVWVGLTSEVLEDRKDINHLIGSLGSHVLVIPIDNNFCLITGGDPIDGSSFSDLYVSVTMVYDIIDAVLMNWDIVLPLADLKDIERLRSSISESSDVRPRYRKSQIQAVYSLTSGFYEPATVDNVLVIVFSCYMAVHLASRLSSQVWCNVPGLADRSELLQFFTKATSNTFNRS